MSTVKYHVGLGVFDDDTWFHHNVGLPKLGTTTVPGTGSTNTGNTAPTENPDSHDREGAPDVVDVPADTGQDDMSDDW
jgi:hypothetical protein